MSAPQEESRQTLDGNIDMDDAQGKFVRHAGDTTAFTMGNAFKCACNGIRYAYTTQRNFKVHTVFAIIAILLGFALQIAPASWLAVVLCIMIVFALETVNTSIESIVDMVSPEWHELAMRAKDCAAGAVFIAAMGSLVVAAIVYLPRIVELIALLAGMAG